MQIYANRYGFLYLNDKLVVWWYFGLIVMFGFIIWPTVST